MSREDIRMIHKRLKKMSLKEFREEMNVIHTRAYKLAEKHYEEAMGIVLQPKQRQAVIEKAQEIRELWDGIREVTIDDTNKGA